MTTPKPATPADRRQPPYRAALGVAAGVMFAAGLGFGFTTTHTSGGDDCGSPFHSNVRVLRMTSDLSRFGDLYAGRSDPGSDGAYAECQSQQNVTRPVAIVFLVLGAAAGFGFVATSVERVPRRPAV
jgi:hypothetical protein